MGTKYFRPHQKSPLIGRDEDEFVEVWLGERRFLVNSGDCYKLVERGKGTLPRAYSRPSAPINNKHQLRKISEAVLEQESVKYDSWISHPLGSIDGVSPRVARSR